MTDVLAVERGLPPGLWLPTAEEPTDQYRVENFNHPNHEYPDIVDFGAFMVALIALEAESTDRVSMMPVALDVRDLHRAGYGLALHKMEQAYGGIAKLQRELGFYPRGYLPQKVELLQRLGWMASYALDVDNEFESEIIPVRDVLEWGAVRDLLPSVKNTYRILGHDTTEVRSLFAIEKPNAPKQYKYHDLYKFGAKILLENKGPISNRVLNEKYRDEFIGTPVRTIRAFFKNTNKFFLEFGVVADSTGLSKEDILLLAIQTAVRSGNPFFSRSRIYELSAQDKFASTYALHHRFESKEEFDQLVLNGYKECLELKEQLESKGVHGEVIRVVFQKVRPGEEYRDWILQNLPTMITLSEKLNAGHELAWYLLDRLENGFNLLDAKIEYMQRADLLKILRGYRLYSAESRRFFYSVMPCVNVDEAMGWKAAA